MPIINSKSQKQLIHFAAMRLARCLVGIVEPCLRGEERPEACRES